MVKGFYHDRGLCALSLHELFRPGINDTWLGMHIIFNAFLARVDDAITAVALSPTVSENQNVGSERRTGLEIELSRKLLATLDGGINYPYLNRDVLSGNYTATDTPGYQVFLFLDWRAIPSLEMMLSLDSQGERWLQSATNNLLYFRGGKFTRMGFKIASHPTPTLMAEIGTKNLTDQNYLVEDGYHAPGREYFLNVRMTF